MKMADETSEKVEKTKGNPMMIILVVLVVLLIGAVGFLAYMMMNQMNAQEASANKSVEKVQEKEESKNEGVFFKAAIENLVLNITNSKGREKLMKLSFSIKSVESTIDVLVAESKDEIIDSVIQQISARSSEELLTVGGKELLREEMLDEINMIINEASSKNEEVLRNNVKKIFFTTFVIK
jgi:flagellar FliL protein